MQESEMKIIPQKQSFWWKIGGWLPVVIMSGIFFSLSYVLQTIPHTSSPVSTGTENVSEGVAWTDWLPLVLTMFIVVIGVTVAWIKREAIKTSMEWKERDTESKKWFWYIIVLIITITFSSVSPSEHRYTVAMITALLGLHIVWLVLLREKTVSAATKVAVTGFLIFFIAAGLLPGTSDYFGAKGLIIKKEVAAKGKKEMDYADKYVAGVTPASESSQQSAPAPATYQPETSRNKITVTSDEFTEVQVPSGAFASFDCPHGAVARYFYTINGGPLQEKDHDCVEPIDIAGLGPVSNLRIGFSSKTEVPQEVRYKITF